MLRKSLVALALLAGLIASGTPARATCQPGYVGIRNGKPAVELPRCEPYPP